MLDHSRLCLTGVLFHIIYFSILYQVFDTYISLFINGTSIDGSAHDARLLVGKVLDIEGVSFIGQKTGELMQFVGRLQDVRFFQTAITNR